MTDLMLPVLRNLEFSDLFWVLTFFNPYGHNSPWLATKTVGANSFAQCA